MTIHLYAGASEIVAIDGEPFQSVSVSGDEVASASIEDGIGFVAGLAEGEAVVAFATETGDLYQDTVIVYPDEGPLQRETYYIQRASRQSVPTSTWGSIPSGWRRSRPSPTTTLSVWAATRTRQRQLGGEVITQPFTVSLVQGPTATPLSATMTLTWSEDDDAFTINAAATVTGGTPPYRVAWTDTVGGPVLAEGLVMTMGSTEDAGGTDTVYLRVIDADGSEFTLSQATPRRPA